ncbi:sugar transferase [Lentibacillus kapialis]|uniref:Sugar transferase n=1 Tax=Lentibacillus kapialis TaxID=340214 RepID=A0A917UZU2_9BACI|nr:sugar transferase [Lentibacillus kapialis]GGK04642.1 sugar transferase [Lentibacillus kapialis]
MKTLQNPTNNPSRQFRHPFQLVCKRLIDIIVSSVCLIILSPLYIGAALSILAEDGRPVFFKQKRSGKDDTAFDIYKLRSMKVTPSAPPPNEPAKQYNWSDRVPDDFVFKQASLHNPNITKTGRFIRKYSLDELPQFYNVLKGDMSMIGPRPEIVEIARCYDNRQQERLRVKPGITGWAQVNGRSSMNHGQKISYDLYYVHHFSLWLDIKIFSMTIYQVLLGKDAS